MSHEGVPRLAAVDSGQMSIFSFDFNSASLTRLNFNGGLVGLMHVLHAIFPMQLMSKQVSLSTSHCGKSQPGLWTGNVWVPNSRTLPSTSIVDLRRRRRTPQRGSPA